MVYFIIALLFGLLMLIPTWCIYDWENGVLSVITIVLLSLSWIGILISPLAACCEEAGLISVTPVEWDANQKGFRKIEVSNLILKSYKHRSFFTFKETDNRYSLVDTGRVILEYKKFEDIVAYYCPNEEGVFVK